MKYKLMFVAQASGYLNSVPNSISCKVFEAKGTKYESWSEYQL